MPFPLLAAIPALLSGLQQNQQAMKPDAISPIKSGQINQDAIARRLNQQQESPLGMLQLGLNALGNQPPEIQNQLGPKIQGAIDTLNPKRGMV